MKMRTNFEIGLELFKGAFKDLLYNHSNAVIVDTIINNFSFDMLAQERPIDINSPLFSPEEITLIEQFVIKTVDTPMYWKTMYFDIDKETLRYYVVPERIVEVQEVIRSLTGVTINGKNYLTNFQALRKISDDVGESIGIINKVTTNRYPIENIETLKKGLDIDYAKIRRSAVRSAS